MNRSYCVMHVTFSFDQEDKAYRYFFRQPLPAGEIYRPRRHFAPWETSAFLNYVMPFDYIRCTWDINDQGVDEAQKVLIEGLSSKTVPGFPEALGEWEYFTGTARDHIKATFLPKGVGLDLAELGLDVDLTPDGRKTVDEKASTCMKRLNRLFAPVRYSNFGQVIEQKDDVYIVLTENDQRLDVRVLPADVYTDGMSLVSTRGAQILFGLKDPKIGDCCRITVAAPFGLAKGHAMVVDLDYDAVFYGVKPDLKWTRGFYSGTLSEELHVSDPNTDFQSLINFFTYNQGLDLLIQMFEKFFAAQVEAVQDSERFHHMMLKVLERNPQTEWVRARAAELGLDACFPGLFRSDAKMMMPIIERTRDGVVPMDGLATRRYIMPSPYMFDTKGNCRPKADRLRGNCVFTAGVPAGPVVLYRQPNGNVDEHWVTACAETPHPNMGRGQIVYLGADMIPEALAAMGGGDFDDPVLVVFHALAVEHFRHLPAYPRVDKAALSKVEDKRNTKYFNRIHGYTPAIKWSIRHLLKQIEDLRNSMGIGVIVNAIMLDTLITVSKPAMLQDLTQQIAAVSASLAPTASASGPEGLTQLEKLTAAYKWLCERPDYVLRAIGSDLESRIDSIKMLGGGGMSQDEELIATMYEDTQVFPWCWTMGGFRGNGRIPARIARLNPVTAKTRLCHILVDVGKEIRAVEDAFLEIEWLLVHKLPEELLAAYPKDAQLREFVSDIRKWWAEEWQMAREKGSSSDKEGVRAVYDRLTDELEAHLKDSEYSTRRDAVAVELARGIYHTTHPSAPMGPGGESTHVPDGLLWTAPLGLAFLEAIDKTGLAGKVVKVDLLPGPRDRGVIPVRCEHGCVYDYSNGKVLGEALKLEDGKYILDDAGYIVVKPVHPSLKMKWRLAFGRV